jgi:ubiquinone/menaquinone biosynthesis C-methylase UbiE
VVLLLETMLAFPDKRALLGEVARVLVPGGRFAFTLEEGAPLTPREGAAMPDADTVWLVELTALVAEVGLAVTWQQEWTRSHLATATALLHAFRADAAEITRRIGRRAAAELIDAHQLWCEWLGSGRVRKFAVVAEKRQVEPR